MESMLSLGASVDADSQLEQDLEGWILEQDLEADSGIVSLEEMARVGPEIGPPMLQRWLDTNMRHERWWL